MGRFDWKWKSFWKIQSRPSKVSPLMPWWSELSSKTVLVVPYSFQHGIHSATVFKGITELCIKSKYWCCCLVIKFLKLMITSMICTKMYLYQTDFKHIIFYSCVSSLNQHNLLCYIDKNLSRLVLIWFVLIHLVYCLWISCTVNYVTTTFSTFTSTWNMSTRVSSKCKLPVEEVYKNKLRSRPISMIIFQC